jgi:hypothetical protein
MTARKLTSNPLFLSTVPAILVGTVLYFMQFNHTKKANREDTQNSKVESLERYRIVDSMEHRTFNARIKKLENKP